MCDNNLDEPGAIVFGPPITAINSGAVCTVSKYHICTKCWKLLISAVIQSKENNLKQRSENNLKQKLERHRFFVPITHEELASKITGAFCNWDKSEYEGWVEDNKKGEMLLIEAIKKSDGYGIPWHDLSSQIRKDLSKCEFDLENVNITDGWGKTKSIVGFKTLPNGMNYLGICAGGDWETSVFFIIYWDGKELRAYIPTDGNPWNTDEKQAYGNHESDDDNAKKRFGVGHEYVEADPKAIVEDMVKRIKLRSSK
jgi:hypothetical protein